MSSAIKTVGLTRPSPERLDAYAAALRRGWSADNIRGRAAADEELRRIGEDAQAFVASLEDRDPRGRSVVLPDGSTVPRLPGFRRWVWDGEFCGSIGFRWQPGTAALPSYVLGHIGYAIVPWKRGRGYASRALALLLPEAWREGLDYVDLTTDPDNLASQKVILNNGGSLVGRVPKAEAYGGGESLLFRIFVSEADRG
jgi:predicted acetyltransferase